MSTTVLPSRPPWRTVALLAGDVVAFIAFAAIGRDSHGLASGLAAVGETAGVAAPFIAGWLAVAPWLGAFSRSGTAGPARMLRTTAIAWPAALLAGSAARALVIGRWSPWSFYLVTFLVIFVLLAAWRLAFALVERRAR